MPSRIKALSLQTLIYGTGHILARLVTFLLLPLYTAVFRPEEYAVVSLAYVFMGFMAVVLHYGLDAALMKYYVPAPAAERRGFLTSAYVSFLISSVIFALLMFLLRRVLAEPLLGTAVPRYVTYTGLILMLDVLWSVPVLLLRSEEKPLAFISYSLLNVILTLGLNLLLVRHYRMGVDGVLIANLIASGTVFLATLPVLLRRLDLCQASRPTWQRLMRFGLPFLPSGICAMIMEMAGRYLLKVLADMETVGLYSAGYKLGMLMMLVVMGFNMAWNPFFLKEGIGPDQDRLYTRITSYVTAALGWVWVLLLLWIDKLVRLPVGGTTFFGAEYWSATAIVPLIALGYIFHATYLLQLPGAYLKEKSSWVAITRAVGAAVTILLNFLLIPRWGAQGAAAAMCLSFATMSATLYIVNRHLYPLHYEWLRLLRVALLLAAVYLVRFRAGDSLGLNLILSLFYPLGLLCSGFLTRAERATLWNFLFRRSGRK